MTPISTIARSLVVQSARAFLDHTRGCDRHIDEASLDEVFYHDSDGRPVTFRAFNRSVEEEIGR